MKVSVDRVARVLSFNRRPARKAVQTKTVYRVVTFEKIQQNEDVGQRLLDLILSGYSPVYMGVVDGTYEPTYLLWNVLHVDREQKLIVMSRSEEG